MIALEKVRDPATNSEAVVGNGDRCVPGDDSNCGDEGPAIKAKLAHPKGKIQLNAEISYVMTFHLKHLLAIILAKTV